MFLEFFGIFLCFLCRFLPCNFKFLRPLSIIKGFLLCRFNNSLFLGFDFRPYRLFIGNSTNLVTTPIALAPGARLVLTTGRMPNSNPYSINANFLTNKCSGYLDTLPQYRFTPALRRSCPSPAKDPGVSNLDRECYDFVSYLSSCHTPKVEHDADGYEFIDNISGLPSSCRAFLEDHFNYNSCVKWHEQDIDFYGTEWRVYLNRSWELWGPNREHITLYDQSGKIVAERSY